jgi:hypothetical protein
VQDAFVEVGLRNDGPDRVELQAAQVDGETRALTGAVDAGATVQLVVGWRVRCAEVGSLRGPTLLRLQVRVPLGDAEARIALPAYDGAPGLGATFHLAAVQACDVLVNKEP